jgi:glycosyltransferase involved in cell wall biosynthesis
VVADAGVLVDPEDESALAAALARVLGSAGERVSLVQRGLARAAHFTSERTAGRVVDLLQATAARRPALARSAG